MKNTVAVAFLALNVVFAAGSFNRAYATNYTWDGGPTATGNIVNTAANWNADGLPTIADTIIFGLVGPLNPTQSAAFSVLNMTFDVGANGYTWNGAGFALTVGSTTTVATRGNITNNSSNTQIINMGGAFRGSTESRLPDALLGDEPTSQISKASFISLFATVRKVNLSVE